MKFIGFAPDKGSDESGVLVDVVNLIPSQKGMAAAATGTAPASIGPLAAPCQGAGVSTNLLGLRRTFAGTANRLYELTGGAWVDRSRAALYTTNPDSDWIFTQFGDSTLATNSQAPVQSSNAGAFSNIAGAPAAKIIVSAANFVLAFNTNDSTFGGQSDRWRCSGIFDATAWTPSLTTQSASGRLVGEGGPITAAIRLGQNVVVFKSRAMWLGQYVGPPVVWQFDQVIGDVGCVGAGALCDINGAILFVADEDIYIYDGTRPRSIADGLVKQWFNANCSAKFKYKTKCSFEKSQNRVYIWFSSNMASDGAIDQALVYNISTGQFGRVIQSAQAVFTYFNAGVTFDTVIGTFTTVANVAYDSPFWLGSGSSQAIIGPNNQILTLDGEPASSSFTTGDFGDDFSESFLRRLRVRYLKAPTSANAFGFTKEGLGLSLNSASSSEYFDSKFDLRQSGRWHRVQVQMTGAHELTGADVDLVKGGVR